MSATSPWWASGLFTVAGALVTAMITLLLGLLNRRSERHRLSRERKEAAYPELTRLAGSLARLPVWPEGSGDPDELAGELESVAQRVAFFSPAAVSRTLPELLDAADQVCARITSLRTDTRPAHGDKVDQRHVAGLAEAVDRLRRATSEFTQAARRDLEIRTRYSPARGDGRPGIGTSDPG